MDVERMINEVLAGLKSFVKVRQIFAILLGDLTSNYMLNMLNSSGLDKIEVNFRFTLGRLKMFFEVV
jgi:hypothetical protein